MARKLPPRRRRLADDIKPLIPPGPTYTKNTTSDWWSQDIPSQVGTGVPPVKPQVIPVSNDSAAPVYWEICRKVSLALLTPDGMYEYPEDWDGTPSSPTWPGGLPDPNGSWLEVPRVHEIIYILEEDYAIKREKFYVEQSPGPTSTFTVEMTVEVASADAPHVPFTSRIPLALLQSVEAQAAIAQAESEVTS